MNVRQALRDHYLRIDPRSLGLFRVGFGAVLIGDLLRRFQHLRELYSNEGVLPNHHHLYVLRDKTPVWSLLHAASTPGEVAVVFCLFLLVYLAYLIGYHTRLSQVAALVALVSLTGRNILLENAGNHLAIGLLAATAFLPLGSRFSLDSLLHSLRARDEKDAAALNDRRAPSPEAIDDPRLPGFSPTSLAALAVILHLVMVHVATALLRQQSTLWRDGSALHYALHNDRWVSAAGVAARDFLSPAALTGWAHAFRAAEWAIPILVLLPVAPRLTRGAAVGIALFHGLTLSLFFSLGLHGFALSVAAALLIPRATWDHIEERANPRRARTMVYDTDCGVCLLTARILKRLDIRGNLTFQGNDDLGELSRRRDGVITRAPIPAGITADLVESTVLAIDPEGRVFTRSRAVAELLQAVPLGWTVAWVLRLPGIGALADVAYDFIASRRRSISVALGKEACGIPGLGEPEPAEDPTAVDPVSPAARLGRRISGVCRDLGAVIVLAAALAQTTHNNPLGWRAPQPRWLAGVATWPRMMERWDVLTDPPTVNELLVIDGTLADGRHVDPLTGRAPETDPTTARGAALGQLWNDYLHRLRDKEWSETLRTFKDALIRGGPRWRDQGGASALVGYDAWWVKQPIPRPGEPRRPALSFREKWFSHGRAGRAEKR